MAIANGKLTRLQAIMSLPPPSTTHVETSTSATGGSLPSQRAHAWKLTQISWLISKLGSRLAKMVMRLYHMMARCFRDSEEPCCEVCLLAGRSDQGSRETLEGQGDGPAKREHRRSLDEDVVGRIL